MNLQSNTVSHRTNARVTGIFYILAALFSILALVLYEPILRNTDYLISAPAKSTQIGIAAIFDCFSVLAVAGTAIMLFPFLRKFNESLALGYLSFRIAEAILILLSIVSILSLLTLTQTYVSDINHNTTLYQPTGVTLKAIHDWAYIIGPNFCLGINTFIYTFIFLHSALVPKNLAWFGIVAAILIFIAAMLEILGFIRQVSLTGIIFALPIFAYEMILAIWLISKGFNKKSNLLI